MQFLLILMTGILLMAAPAQARNLSLDGELTQGGLVMGNVSPDAQVWLDGEEVDVGSDGLFLLGFSYDAHGESLLEVLYSDGQRHRKTLEIDQRLWPEQHIKGLPARKVDPNPKDLEHIKRDAELIWEVRDNVREFAYFKDKGFIWPTIGRISGVFGARRVLNGKAKRPHVGVDVAAPRGTPVYAAADGEVELAENDMFFTGKTVMINHGFGLTSIYGHLNSTTVLDGMSVRQGDMIGTVGSTGRATGPHLHWGVSLYDVFLDPVLLVGDMPKKSTASADATKTTDAGDR